MAFGKVLYILGCGSLNALSVPQKAMDTFTRQYSSELHNIAYFLVSKPGQRKVVPQFHVRMGLNK